VTATCARRLPGEGHPDLTCLSAFADPHSTEVGVSVDRDRGSPRPLQGPGLAGGVDTLGPQSRTNLAVVMTPTFGEKALVV
jgi:hypothetical protein